MAHGQKPGTISKILAPGPLPCPRPGLPKKSQEERRGEETELSAQPLSTLRNDNNDQRTSSAANLYYMSCDPSPEDMEDTCSEYDNMGSDVEQDYDEVLHLNREGVMDMRYYKQYCPEEGVFKKVADAGNLNESIGTTEPEPHHSTDMCEGTQPEAKTHKASYRLRSHHSNRAQGQRESGQENKFFFSDGEEVEVLDGVKFIEDLEEAENCERPVRICKVEDNDRTKKAVEAVKRPEELIKRNYNTPVGNKKPEPSYNGAREKERQSRGRGRKAAGQDAQPVASGVKASAANKNGQRPKMPSKENKKASVRSKAKCLTAKQTPPSHLQSPTQIPATTERVQPCRDPPPRTSPPAKESRTHSIETPPLSPHVTDHQSEPLEERLSRPEKAQLLQQSGKPNGSPHEQELPTRPEYPAPTPEAEASRTRIEKPRTAPIPNQQDAPECRELHSQKDSVMPEREKPRTTVMLEEPDATRRPGSAELTPEEESNAPGKSQEAASFPSFEDVPGPCEPEDLIDGIIFAANYLGCTQVLSDKNPTKTVRMTQAHEAVSQIKGQDEDSQMVTEVDLFISTKAVKVLNADTQETMMDSALRTISYIADIGSIVVLMARRRMSQTSSEDFCESPDSASEGSSQCRMICYVFESEDAQLIAQSIGQAFSVAYREFLRANGINPTDLSQKQYSDIINSQEMYHDDLVHFSNSDNCKELYVEKQKGENLGVVIVESGWGSILPTVILACMLNSGPAARSGKLSVGDQIMSINDTSLVGLPLATCQGIIKGLKNQVKIKLSIVSCPPVTTVLIKRPDLKFQLGFSVQNGIICSLMRGGIAERGGVRVGHRIIEINGQSVVAMPHEKIVQTLSVSVGEINMKTMPAVMFRLLTGQETPAYI
ncbi:LOW QUALITY PROTEIN: uncharacterized protein apba2a [Synchiropus picturatus]